MKWDTKRAAITGGIVWGAALFLLTLLSVWTGIAVPFLQGIASVYIGYTISITGSVIGLIYGFIDVFVGVYITVWVYKQLGKNK
ncbi:MAG TPA: hypothetical protein VND99_00765 [Candidatus Acidoferrales bacterium]|nr:hypothetical protein [Candidatus Acidoferrales bacterium]